MVLNLRMQRRIRKRSRHRPPPPILPQRNILLHLTFGHLPPSICILPRHRIPFAAVHHEEHRDSRLPKQGITKFLHYSFPKYFPHYTIQSTRNDRVQTATLHLVRNRSNLRRHHPEQSRDGPDQSMDLIGQIFHQFGKRNQTAHFLHVRHSSLQRPFSKERINRGFALVRECRTPLDHVLARIHVSRHVGHFPVDGHGGVDHVRFFDGLRCRLQFSNVVVDIPNLGADADDGRIGNLAVVRYPISDDRWQTAVLISHHLRRMFHLQRSVGYSIVHLPRRSRCIIHRSVCSRTIAMGLIDQLQRLHISQ
mmetsp:Transcript_31851/g.60879  ORF Transcript_31851/g.60879 Transcript_31851/m.60879 type:complete len:308 (+) Transcript_31851:376-1299(+)